MGIDPLCPVNSFYFSRTDYFSVDIEDLDGDRKSEAALIKRDKCFVDCRKYLEWLNGGKVDPRVKSCVLKNGSDCSTFIDAIHYPCRFMPNGFFKVNHRSPKESSLLDIRFSSGLKFDIHKTPLWVSDGLFNPADRNLKLYQKVEWPIMLTGEAGRRNKKLFQFFHTTFFES